VVFRNSLESLKLLRLSDEPDHILHPHRNALHLYASLSLRAVAHHIQSFHIAGVQNMRSHIGFCEEPTNYSMWTGFTGMTGLNKIYPVNHAILSNRRFSIVIFAIGLGEVLILFRFDMSFLWRECNLMQLLWILLFFYPAQ